MSSQRKKASPPRRRATSRPGKSPEELAVAEPFEPDDPRAVDLVMQMMAIAGTSGQESEIAEFIMARLVDAGVSRANIKFDSAHRRSPVAGQIGNMVLKLAGTTRGPRRMLSAHIDTVPVCIA